MNGLHPLLPRVPTLSSDLPQSPLQLLKNLLVGCLFDSLLFGVVAVQCITYWKDFPSHSPTIRWTVLALFFFNILQTACNQIGIVEILTRVDNYEWLSWAGSASVVFIGHLAVPFLMGIPHVLLSRKCIAFANTLDVWKPRWRTSFAFFLYAGTTVCFLSGMAANISLLVQAKLWSKDPTPGILDWYAIMISVNLTTSATMDLLLSGVLVWELKMSHASEICASNRVIESVIKTLFSSGLGLAILQICLCGVYLSGLGYTFAAVGFLVLGKAYSITAMLSICRPLELQRMVDLSPVRVVDFLCSDTGTQESTLVGRIVGLVKKRGGSKDSGNDEDTEKGFAGKRSHAASPTYLSTTLTLPVLGKHDPTAVPTSSLAPSSASLSRASSHHPKGGESYGLDMSYILSDMEPEGVVAFRVTGEQETQRKWT